MRRESTKRRDLRAYRLRQRGWTLQRIADQLEMGGPSTAFYAIDRCRRESVRPVAEFQRDLACDHLDQLSEQAWAVLDDPGPVISSGRVIKDAAGEPLPDRRLLLEALRVLVMVDERRAKLCGLDAPRRQAIQVVTDEVLDTEIARLTAGLALREAQRPVPLAITTGGVEVDR